MRHICKSQRLQFGHPLGMLVEFLERRASNERRPRYFNIRELGAV